MSSYKKTDIRNDFQKTSEFAFLGLFHHVFKLSNRQYRQV